MATPRPTPEQQITNRLKNAGQSFLKSRKEFAAASAQMDSMSAAQHPEMPKGVPAAPPNKPRVNKRLLPKGVA